MRETVPWPACPEEHQSLPPGGTALPSPPPPSGRGSPLRLAASAAGSQDSSSGEAVCQPESLAGPGAIAGTGLCPGTPLFDNMSAGTEQGQCPRRQLRFHFSPSCSGAASWPGRVPRPDGECGHRTCRCSPASKQLLGIPDAGRCPTTCSRNWPSGESQPHLVRRANHIRTKTFFSVTIGM